MESAIDELKFCIKLWGSQGHCNFGGETSCKSCGSPYVLWKMVSGEVLHDESMKRLTLNDWKEKIANYEN